MESRHLTSPWLLCLVLALPANSRAEDDLGLLRFSRQLLDPGCWLGAVDPDRLQSRPFARMSAWELNVYLWDLKRRKPDARQRLLTISERFLGVPYLTSPLGEGRGRVPDPDPLIRFDGVDCTTLVEQVMAMALSGDVAQLMTNMRNIRYIGGRIGYTGRKHFVMAQWVPLNQRAGLLRDITQAIGGQRVKWAAKRLDLAGWHGRRKKVIWPQLEDAAVPVGTYRLPFVPLADVLRLAGKIPTGTLVNVIRRDFRTVPERVTHQGLIVVKGGRRFMRHASRSLGRVADEALEHFVARNRAYGKWPVDGFNFQQVFVKVP